MTLCVERDLDQVVVRNKIPIRNVTFHDPVLCTKSHHEHDFASYSVRVGSVVNIPFLVVPRQKGHKNVNVVTRSFDDHDIKELDCNRLSLPKPRFFKTLVRSSSEKLEKQLPPPEPCFSKKHASSFTSLLKRKHSKKICPDCAAYYSNRSACYMMLGKYSDALSDALQAVKLDSTFVKGYIRVGKCNIALGDANAAISVLKQASELEPNNQGVRDELNNAQTLLRHQDDINKAINKKDYRTAIYYLDRAQEVAVGCKQLKTTKAEYLVFLGRYQEAQEIVNEILQFDNGNVEAIFVRGMCLYYEDNFDTAFNHFQHVLRLAPDHQKAKDIYKRGKSLKTKKEEGNQAFNKGDLAAAYSLYTEALNIDPNNKFTNSKLYFNRATVGFKLNKLEDAVNDCTAAISLDECYVKAYLRRAKCYQSIEQHEEAVRDFEKVFKLDANQEHKRLLTDAKAQLKRSKRKDYYKILGVSKTAGEEEIKKSYRKKALIHHPDRHANASDKDKRQHEIQFKEIGEAYAILTDPKKRSMYDRGHDINDPCMGHEEFDAEHIYQSFFGDATYFTRPGGIYTEGFPGNFHFQFS